MAEKGKRYPNPRFQSIDEEVAYWDQHSPITEGYEGRLQRGRRKRDSFLAVRLSGEELERLRQVASRKGVGTSTFARSLILGAIGEGALPAKFMTMPEFQDVLGQVLQDKVDPDTWRDILQTYESTVIGGDPTSPTVLLADQESIQKFERFSKRLLLLVLEYFRIHVVTGSNAASRNRTPSTQDS
jgi:hypothetical protein